MSTKYQPKQRDIIVLLAFRKEINLKTKSIKSKKAYSRKQKHRSQYV